MFITKDSGKREEYSTGARRDTNEGKPRYDLISSRALKRLAEHMARGANKYGARNREKGIPNERFLESGLRHLHQYIQGDTEEDHLCAVLFNIMGIVHNQEIAKQKQFTFQDWDGGDVFVQATFELQGRVFYIGEDVYLEPTDATNYTRQIITNEGDVFNFDNDDLDLDVFLCPV